MKSCHHLESYLDNKLPPDERRRFEDHLLNCAPCREETAVWNKIASVVQEIGQEQIDAQPMTPPPRQRAASNLELNRRQSTAVPIVVRWAAAAAVLAVVAVLLLFMGNSGKKDAPSSSAGPVSFKALYFTDNMMPKKQIVTTGSLIRTKEGQRILINLGNDDVGLKAGSVVSVEKADRQEKILHLESGTLACSVNPKSHDNPFVIHAGNYRIQVVGTEFSVTFEDNGGLIVAVKKGIVDVTDLTDELIERITTGKNLRIGQDTKPSVSVLSSEKNAEIDALLSPLPNDVPEKDDGKPDTHIDDDGNSRSTEQRKSNISSTPKEISGTSRNKQNAKEHPVNTWQNWVLSGRIDEAEKALEKYVRTASNDAEAWFLLADCRKRKKSYSEAVSIYKRAIPNISERAADTARYRAAVILQDNLGAHRKAIHFLEQFLKRVDRAHHLRAEAMLRLGISLRATGQTERANNLFRQIVENHGATASAVRAKKLLNQLP